ncbi:Tet-like J-binding protein [Arthrobacter phage Altadena]|uniref:Tet-like J-binding protein n=1 Tax=Arthrobacter phage Altadena TaxID=3059064 RepID=A0AA96HUJ3_9CAUD|nr:Tet-like J-binding protein [Arthrobacter phage Altadena]
MTDDLEFYARRVLSRDEATALIGSDVETELAPSFPGIRDGQSMRIYDLDTGDLIGIVTRLDRARRAALRAAVLSIKYGQNVARQGRAMSVRGATFGYAPKKAMARQEGCRATATTRDRPDVAAVLDDIAGELGRQFRDLYPSRAAEDEAIVKGAVLDDWRMHEDSLWTSGVINQSTVLPYHRDGNNFNTWSAMPTLRYGMDDGRLHIPEYDLVLPCGDGDVSWFFGKDLVHGVTPMTPRRPDAYRYSVVFYSIQGMKNCRTFAEETRNANAARTARERAAAAAIRAGLGLSPETVPDAAEGPSEILDLETGELA